MRKRQGEGPSVRTASGAVPSVRGVTSVPRPAPCRDLPSPPMRLLLVAVVALAAAGCGSSGPPAYFPSPDLGARVDAVRIPEGYAVQSASFGLAYATGVSGGTDVNGTTSPVSSSSYERPFVNVFAVETATGAEVLLVYELGRRADPVLIIELEASPTR